MTAAAATEDPDRDLARAVARLGTTGREEATAVLDAVLDALEAGSVRAAWPDPTRPGGWRPEPWVKEAILAAFTEGEDVDLAVGPLPFRDRASLLPRREVPAGARVVPGGTALRRGAHLGRQVVVMPPAYINVGAFVGDGSLVDSHALVGSCAQVGRRVHVSAAVQIGGVLEPAGALPVIVEDEAFLGGGVGLYEGVVVGYRAVVAAGVVLTASSAIYDLTTGEVIRADPSRGLPLVVPAGAVVVPGTRPAEGGFARRHSLALVTPVIVKRRDRKTDAKVALEAALRGAG